MRRRAIQRSQRAGRSTATGCARSPTTATARWVRGTSTRSTVPRIRTRPAGARAHLSTSSPRRAKPKAASDKQFPVRWQHQMRIKHRIYGNMISRSPTTATTRWVRGTSTRTTVPRIRTRTTGARAHHRDSGRCSREIGSWASINHSLKRHPITADGDVRCLSQSPLMKRGLVGAKAPLEETRRGTDAGRAA